MTTRAPRAPRAKRKPRNPDTRQTKVPEGQVWTVAMGTVDGRVKRADYRLYMRSPEWISRRWGWWNRTGRPTTCAACGGPWSLNSGHLHHKTYDRFGYEKDTDLVNLCEPCHARVHITCTKWSELEKITDQVIATIQAERA